MLKGQKSAWASWSSQWDLANVLERRTAGRRGTRDKPESGETHDMRDIVSPFETEPVVTAGQIRLLSPSLLPDERGPTYVAVLQQLGVGAFLVAPFSPFQDPATPHEIAFRNTPPALSVLSLWNARAVSSFVLSQSWFVDELTEQEITDAMAVYRSVCRLAELPVQLTKRVGAPLIDLLDPRFSYKIGRAHV